MPECAVCQEEKEVAQLAVSCESHDPQVCKPCLRKWLRRTDTCPVCRAVVHARAVKPKATSRKRSLSEDEKQADDDKIEQEYEEARKRARQREKQAQEREDHRMALQLAREEDARIRRRTFLAGVLLDSGIASYVALDGSVGGDEGGLYAALMRTHWHRMFSDYIRSDYVGADTEANAGSNESGADDSARRTDTDTDTDATEESVTMSLGLPIYPVAE